MQTAFHRALLLTAALACGLVPSAHADIYWFTDEDGVAHFSNVPTDARYKPFMKTPDGVRGPSLGSGSARRPDAAARIRYDPIIDTVARTHALDSALLHAVVTAESAYDAAAVSKKGAAGLMQLMPETARRYGVSDRLDPVQNLHGGARYLSDLLKMFDGNLSLALAGYNAGENSVVRYGYQIPPFAETRHYVPKVLDLYRRYQDERAPGRRKGA